MSNLTLGNIAIEAQRAVRLNSQAYGDRVLRLFDDYTTQKQLSYGGLKELRRAREIFCAHFYSGDSTNIHSMIQSLMLFAFKERN